MMAFLAGFSVTKYFDGSPEEAAGTETQRMLMRAEYERRWTMSFR